METCFSVYVDKPTIEFLELRNIFFDVQGRRSLSRCLRECFIGNARMRCLYFPVIQIRRNCTRSRRLKPAEGKQRKRDERSGKNKVSKWTHLLCDFCGVEAARCLDLSQEERVDGKSFSACVVRPSNSALTCETCPVCRQSGKKERDCKRSTA